MISRLSRQQSLLSSFYHYLYLPFGNDRRSKPTERLARRGDFARNGDPWTAPFATAVSPTRDDDDENELFAGESGERGENLSFAEEKPLSVCSELDGVDILENIAIMFLTCPGTPVTSSSGSGGSGSMPVCCSMTMPGIITPKSNFDQETKNSSFFSSSLQSTQLARNSTISIFVIHW